jgi:hypothetical protein
LLLLYSVATVPLRALAKLLLSGQCCATTVGVVAPLLSGILDNAFVVTFRGIFFAIIRLQMGGVNEEKGGGWKVRTNTITSLPYFHILHACLDVPAATVTAWLDGHVINGTA